MNTAYCKTCKAESGGRRTEDSSPETHKTPMRRRVQKVTIRSIQVIRMVSLFLFLLLAGQVAWAEEDLWQITFYCACPKCCGKWADGITASGHKVDDGVVACNILPMWTIVHIEGFGYRVVMDRGARKYFDGKKHIDIYVNDHEKAKQLGVMWQKVKVIKQVSQR